MSHSFIRYWVLFYCMQSKWVVLYLSLECVVQQLTDFGQNVGVPHYHTYKISDILFTWIPVRSLVSSYGARHLQEPNTLFKNLSQSEHETTTVSFLPVALFLGYMALSESSGTWPSRSESWCPLTCRCVESGRRRLHSTV